MFPANGHHRKKGFSKQLVPAFVEARERKLRDECTDSRIFPVVSTKGHVTTAEKDFFQPLGGKKSFSLADYLRSSNLENWKGYRNYQSRSSTRSHATTRSVDSGLSLLRNHQTSSKQQLRRSSSQQHVATSKQSNRRDNIHSSNSLPDISRGNTKNSSKRPKHTSPAHTKRSETENAMQLLSEHNSYNKVIKQWFDGASDKEKELGYELLSMLSRGLSSSKQPTSSEHCVKPVENCTTPSRSQHSNHYSSRYHVQTSSDPVNLTALTYNTSQLIPSEFVIHPEWHEPVQITKLPEATIQTPEIELRYGYWKKK